MISNHPVSPHLQIYRLPLTALLSITHRATGVFIAFGALVLVWVLVTIASGPEAYQALSGHLSSWYGQIFLFGLTLSVYIHFCNGIRHLFWDVGIGFDLDVVDKSAKLAIIVALILTIATWVVAVLAG
ncbi:MAG: succinate dehydrogenase / fumarate reductase cytochrome b subunit [Gammaproteobacteria bacterium]|jgi:succinate dehydrogenase / fumarate reductase cytochrome b subunit